ncbi:MAG: peptidoglycan-binding protein [Scytonema sp. PMC 1069.18]|nr:peptidoglycan-binding protein [Scytonema sp. PMC 1069.18]MEC4884144.1 peptidoglycan-binding protein [Scytonema sp. PMC 1070.18]
MATTTFVTLKEGSTGPAVTKLQQRLKTLSFYSGAIDGIFGPATKAAVIKFQQNNAVTVDGIVGLETEAAIQRDIWVLQRPTLQQGASGQEVKRMQELLKRAEDISREEGGSLKLDIGAIDGIFGPKTKAAVIKFQKDRKIKDDGIVGRVTWEQLSFVLTYDLSPEQIVLNNVFNLA